MANIVPTQLSSAEGLFRDRLGLTPDKVKGVDPAKLSNIKKLIANRTDIGIIPWNGEFAEATSIDQIAGGTLLSSVTRLKAPKATSARNAFEGSAIATIGGSGVELPLVADAQEMFKNAKIERLDTINIPALSTAANMFEGATIAKVAGGMKTTSSLSNTTFAFQDARVEEVNTDVTDWPFSDCSGVKNALRMFANAYMTEVYGLNFASGCNQAQIFAGVKKITELHGLRTENAGPGELGDRFGHRGNIGELTHFGETIVGTFNPQVNGPIPQWGDLTGRNIETIDPDIVTGLTDMTSDPRGAPAGVSWFSEHKLNQASVDSLINSVDKSVTAGATYHSKNITIAGRNAAPSAAVISGPIARLTAAGWTITHS